MSVARLGQDRLIDALADLGTGFVLTDLGKTSDCLSIEALRASAANNAEPDMVPDHVRGCARCSSIFAAYRSVHCIRQKSDSWSVKLLGIDFPSSSDWAYEILGRINYATEQFAVCEDESEWTPHPLAIRVNLNLDPDSGLFTLTLLETPSQIESVSIALEELPYELDRAEVEGVFELTKKIGIPGSDDFGEKFERLVNIFESGRAELVFEIAETRTPSASHESPPDNMLVQEQVIERDADYELPCGLHSDTFVNIGRLCHSEGALARVAAALYELFAGLSFDTIITNGWAMATIARRLASLCRWPGLRPVREIMCEGYDPPIPTEDIAKGSRVLVLVDVVVTGRLLEGLTRIVHEASATVVGTGSVAKATSSKVPDTVRFLCAVAMGLDKPQSCSRCRVLPRLEFNPFANCMTVKLAHARSPSQFIAYNNEAREFWEYVDKADAYRKHFIERNCHYTAFVDTACLLAHPDIGPTLVENLRVKVLAHSPAPTVFLVPRRQRAELLAKSLAKCLEFALPPARSPIVFATRHKDAWRLTQTARSRLHGKRVLIVDSAAGYGRTIDYLAMAATRAGAESVGAAVILSRVTDACEAALQARLRGGFFRLFHLPIRPVVIRGNDPSLCPFCRRKAAVRDAAKESGLEAIQWWADRLSQPPFTCSESNRPAITPKREEQPSLFPIPDPTFLERCRGSVAGGVTLHSLHAAMRNGMAPLALPEIRDETIPAKNRTAMIESLPFGVVEWSRGFLENDLLHFLASGRTASLWRASAEVLARETGAKWVGHLGDILKHAKTLRRRPMPTFWNSLACDAYLVVHRDPETKQFIQECLRALVNEYEKTPAGDGLRQILAATE